MNNLKLIPALACLLSLAPLTQAQLEGPFPPDQWPASANPDATVHYVSVGDVFTPLGANWITGNMQILTGGDHATQPITIGGFEGLKAVDNYLNTADFDFTEWADDETIDILMQVYGDGALFNPQGEPRDFRFLIGTVPELDDPVGGQIPVEARNRKWNWVLFRIPNTIRPSDGTRRVGSIPANAGAGSAAGGVNGGTIRMQGVPNLIVRAVAFGEMGAFGEPEQVNLFAPGEECEPEPETNLAWIDIANDQSHHLEIINSGDQTSVIEEGIGPEGDKRRAVRPEGLYLNFGITDNYLGLPCNDARTIKFCVEFYDDPNLRGFSFGPEAYATDDQGGVAFVPEDQRHTLQGTGQWLRRSWIIPSVNLFGVNTAPLTAGPRLFFGWHVYISRVDLGILRTGNHPLAGQDPLPDCFSDPDFCAGIYGNYAELDFTTGLQDGLAPGASAGDQEMIEAEAGPANDRRWALRPAFDDASNTDYTHQYLNFAIIEEKLGPNHQPGVTLAICMTYYDDPALAGESFRPDVYYSDLNGTVNHFFPPASLAVTLEGTDTWRDAYFELPAVKFIGVNQGPQAAARFAFSYNDERKGKIFINRVRYGVIRPCGPDANVNPLEECKPADPVLMLVGLNPDGTVRIAWPVLAEGYVLEESAEASPASWTAVATAPTVEGEDNVITITPGSKMFYRLVNNGGQ